MVDNPRREWVVSADRSQPEDSSTDVTPVAGVLTVTAPATEAGRSVAVEPDGTTVGRDVTCDLTLASDDIELHHAVVRQHGSLYVVEDLGSRNRTRLNGEPVVGTRPLLDGDHLSLADVEVVFHLLPLPVRQPRRPGPYANERWRSADLTDPQGHETEAARRPLSRELREAPGFSAPALVLAVMGAMVTTTLTGVAGAGPWGTLMGAAVGPVVTTTFTTKRAGEKGRVRTAAIIILTLAAVVITWVGIGLADRAAGRSIIPGTEDRPNTFPGPVAGPEQTTPSRVATSSPSESASPSATASSTASGPAATVSPVVLDCGTTGEGSTVTCPELTISSTGAEGLNITQIELTGDDAGDFIAHEECVGRTLAPGETCTMTVDFQPQAAGPRQAVLVIHQNIPPPDTGTRVDLIGQVE